MTKRVKNIDGNYTKTPNELLEALMRVKLNGTQYRIIIAVNRYTYGFNRDNHELSISFLSKATGIHPQHIKKELRSLIKMRILSIIREASFSKSRVISINENFDTWDIEWYQVGKEIPGTKVGTTPGTKVGTQETKPKQKLKETKSDYSDEFKIFWETYPRKEGKATAYKRFKKALKNYPIEDLLKAAENYAQAVQGTEPKFIKKANNFFGDETYLDYIEMEPLKKVENWRGSDRRLE